MPGDKSHAASKPRSKDFRLDVLKHELLEMQKLLALLATLTPNDTQDQETVSQVTQVKNTHAGSVHKHEYD